MKFLILVAVMMVLARPACTPTTEAITFDWTGSTAVQGKNMNTLTCVKDTQIDFNFPQQTSTTLNITNVTATTYRQFYIASNSINDQLTMQFLDRTGVNNSYRLKQLSLTNYNAGARIKVDNSPNAAADLYQLSMTYQNATTNADVVISILLGKSGIAENVNVFKHAKAVAFYSQLDGVYTLVKNIAALTAASTQISNLNAISAFNSLDLSKFYTQYNSNSSCSTTFLLNNWVYQLDVETSTTVAAAITTSAYTALLPIQQSSTGNFLCWGANTNLGTFQTHMRDNFALWAAWWSVLIFWCALLFGEATTLNCFDKKFEEKKWTCWSYYSLFYLAHEEFFTRMMRLVPHYLNFSWQACVAAILYCHIGETYQDASTIAWFGAIAFACSIPLPWVFGIFSKRVYNAQLQKYTQQLNIKKLFDKEGKQARIYEDRIDECESVVFGSYYWMYVFAFACYVTFWTLAVNRLQLIRRELYDQQKYWLAALGVAWGFDTFVYEPLMTLLFGNTSFWRFRPYFYDYRIGEIFKQLEG